MSNKPTALAADTIAGRRYLTIVFCDIVGFTEFSENVDPEDLKELQQRYQQLGVQVIEAYGGFAASFSGDGILAYFGYPSAHENDAERAVRAALDLVQKMSTLELSLHGTQLSPFAVRIGIHTGLVAVGTETGSGQIARHTVVGEPVNAASRIQSEAKPNTVVVSNETRELIDGLFEFEPLGPHAVKGLSRPLVLYRPVKVRTDLDRFGGRARRGATRMVGRERELETLFAQFRSAKKDARTKVVAVSGEPGVGKTRLVTEFCRSQELRGATIVQLSCSEIFANTPLNPFVNFIRARADIRSEEPSALTLKKLAGLLSEFGLSSSGNLEIIADIIELKQNQVHTPAQMPHLTKQRRIDFLVDLLGRIGGDGMRVFWIEDAHWLDPSSTELLQVIVAELRSTTSLVVMGIRLFPRRTDLPAIDETIHLSSLAFSQSIDLARTVPGSQALSPQALQSVAEASEGVPLFVEQFVLSVIAGGVLPTGGTENKRQSLPLALAEMLSERLDRLPNGRRVVQAAACIGKSFSPQFLSRILSDVARASLDALVEAEILRSHGDGTETTYEFRHALLRRVAHDSTAKTERQAFHSRIADVLGEPDGQEPSPAELIAYHLTEAGRVAEGARRWLEAGMAAARRPAPAEAIDHLRRGLALVAQLPNSDAIELPLQAALIGPLTAVNGATSLDLSICCQRGLELCAKGPSSPLIFPFLFGLFTFSMCRGNTIKAAPLADSFLSLAERTGYDSGRVIGHRLKGMALLGQGKAADARAELERSLSLYSEARDGATTHMFGQNTQVHSRSLSSLAMLCLGDVEGALTTGVEALRGADALHHPHSTAIALGYVGGWVFGLVGATELMTRHARKLIALAEHHKLGPLRSFGTAFLGWALCQHGDLEQGIAVLQQALDEFEAVSFRMSITGHLAVLADAKRRTGKLDEAATLCTRAQLWIAEGADRWLEPEVLRGAALIRRDRLGQADASVETALASAAQLARDLEFPIFELRCLKNIVEHGGPIFVDAARVQARISELRTFDKVDETAVQILKKHADVLNT